MPSTTPQISHRRTSRQTRRHVPQPLTRNPCRVSHAQGLAYIRFRSPLLTESQLFSLPAGTEMFHFPAFPPLALYIQMRVTPHDGCRVTPFGHPRIKALLAAPRGLSRPATSFIGSWCQGIHRVPLNTYTQKQQDPHNRSAKSKIQMLASTIQSQTPHQTPDHHTTTSTPHQRARRYSARPGPGPKNQPRTRPAPSGPNSGCPRTQQLSRHATRRRETSVYDVSTHEHRHRTPPVTTGLARAGPLQADRARSSLERR